MLENREVAEQLLPVDTSVIRISLSAAPDQAVRDLACIDRTWSRWDAPSVLESERPGAVDSESRWTAMHFHGPLRNSSVGGHSRAAASACWARKRVDSTASPRMADDEIATSVGTLVPYRVHGSQRFTFPDLYKAMWINPATRRSVKPKLKKTAFTLRPNTEEAMRVIEHLSGFAFKSQLRKAWRGLRSHVESNNWDMKADAETDLGNPETRSARLRVPRAYVSGGVRRPQHAPHRQLHRAQAVAALAEKVLRERMKNRTE